MRFPSIQSIRSNGSHQTIRYTSYSDEEEEESVIPPPPPPPPPISPPPADYPTLPPWPDDLSAMTNTSEVSGRMTGETKGATPTPSKQSLEGEKYLDDEVASSRNPPASASASASASTSAAVELELAIYDRLEKARRVEMDLAKDEKNKRDSRKQRLCISIVLFFALLVLCIGLGQGLKGRGTKTNKKSISIDPADDANTSDAMTEGPVTKDELTMMLVGVSPQLELSVDATNTLKDAYCNFFESFYNEPRESDWLRSNVNVVGCEIEIRPVRRVLRDLEPMEWYIVPFSQTFTLAYPNAKNSTLVSASMEYVVAAPFKDVASISRLVDDLKSSSQTDAFMELRDVVFEYDSGMEPTIAGAIDGTVASTSVPSSSPTHFPVSIQPTVTPTTASRTLLPTSEPTKRPRSKDKDKKKNKDKDKD